MLAGRYDAFLVDLDGVVYVGDRALPGAAAALARLRELGKAVRFLTNDPVPTRAELVARLRLLGVDAEPGEVISAGWATARWLAEAGVRRVFVAGSPGLRAELAEAGLELVEEGPEAVVVGADPDLTLGRVARACIWIARGARFVATNPDLTYPTPWGPLPATGALVRAVEAVTGVAPTVIGKPKPHIFRLALATLPAGCRAAMVGDNPETDVAGARRAGIAAILVAPDGQVPADGPQPDAVIRALAELVAPGDG